MEHTKLVVVCIIVPVAMVLFWLALWLLLRRVFQTARRCILKDEHTQGKTIHCCLKTTRRIILTSNFSFLVTGSDIDTEMITQEFYSVVLTEQSPERVRFTFNAMKIFFSVRIF